jgi:tRNA A37 N6-isopentenylltransferase MiaA
MKYKNIVVYYSGYGYQADYYDGNIRIALHRACLRTKKDAYEYAKQQVDYLKAKEK